MAIYSKQKWFCNCCGKEQFSELPNVFGRNWRVCSSECLEEINHRETLSIMGKIYIPLAHLSRRKDIEQDKEIVGGPDDCYRGCQLCDGAADCTCPYCHKENK